MDPPTSSLRQVAGSYHRSSGTKVERVGEVFGGPRGRPAMRTAEFAWALMKA